MSDSLLASNKRGVVAGQEKNGVCNVFYLAQTAKWISCTWKIRQIFHIQDLFQKYPQRHTCFVQLDCHLLKIQTQRTSYILKYKIRVL